MIRADHAEDVLKGAFVDMGSKVKVALEAAEVFNMRDDMRDRIKKIAAELAELNFFMGTTKSR